jgi:DNA-binding transcriptional ArsR family regulator
MTYDRAMDALGDPTRRAVFERLRSGPRPVVEIARDLPVSRPAVSQHLKVLREAGLVRDHPEGSRRLYEIDPAGLSEVRAFVEGLWDQALERFKSLAEGEEKEGRSG